MKQKFDFEEKKLRSLLGRYYGILKDCNAYIAGGAITSLFTRQDINDFDIYFKTKKDAWYFIDEMRSNVGIVTVTDKAILMKSNGGLLLQAIFIDGFPTAKDIFDKFDFTVCMGAYDFAKEKFVLHEDFLKHNAQRMLHFNENTSFPLISALRVDKYKTKGYSISKLEFLKIIFACRNVDINNVEEFKHQCGGMYGYNYDKILDSYESKDDNFNALDVIRHFEQNYVGDSYFIEPTSNDFTFSDKDFAKLYVNLFDLKPQCTTVNQQKIYFADNEIITDYDDKKLDITEIDDFIDTHTFYCELKCKDGKFYANTGACKNEFVAIEDILLWDDKQSWSSQNTYVRLLNNSPICYVGNYIAELASCEGNEIKMVNEDRLYFNKLKVVRILSDKEFNSMLSCNQPEDNQDSFVQHFATQPTVVVNIE